MWWPCTCEAQQLDSAPRAVTVCQVDMLTKRNPPGGFCSGRKLAADDGKRLRPLHQGRELRWSRMRSLYSGHPGGGGRSGVPSSVSQVRLPPILGCFLRLECFLTLHLVTHLSFLSQLKVSLFLRGPSLASLIDPGPPSSAHG